MARIWLSWLSCDSIIQRFTDDNAEMQKRRSSSPNVGALMSSGLAPRQWHGMLLSKWETMRASYWFVPVLMAAGASLTAFVLLELDDGVRTRWVERLPLVRSVSVEGSRAVLSAIVASMITVTGVVFSITIVALTLASSQFGPRILNNFLRDRGNQLVLGTFLATFLYSMLVLGAVREDRVPVLATTLALLLAVISLFVLIYFIHHAASSIQASSIVAAIAGEIDVQIDHLFPEDLGTPEAHAAESEDDERLATLENDYLAATAPCQGYLRVLDQDALLDLTAEHDLTIRLTCRPGDFVVAGATLARVAPSARVSAEIRQAIADAFVLGDQRTAIQDLDFLIGQLTEMAVRALSPGTNDPRTAVACVHRLGALLATVAGRATPDSQRYDEVGHLRVIASPTTFADLAGACLDPIRRYGAKDAEVVLALLAAIETAGDRTTESERRLVLAEHAREILAGFTEDAPASERDHAAVRRAGARVLSQLGTDAKGPPTCDR